MPAEQLVIYVREGIGFTKLDQSRWKGEKDSEGRIIVTFTPLLQATEIKIHCNYDDLDILQLPVDRAEFYNAPGELATVYQKLTTRTETYQYDAMGNRTVEQLMLQRQHVYTYEYYSNSNRLQSNGRYHYEYDANGNLIKKTKNDGSEVWEYAYDLFNQLVEVRKDGAVAASYSYDPAGFRVQKTGSQGTIHYVQLLNGEVGYTKELASGKETAYIYVGIQRLARVDGVIGGPGKKYYYHNDHLGSGLSITDEEGNKVMERDFAPFGERIHTDIEGEEGIDPAEDDSGFTGKDWDEDIGLYYYNARWYDPEIGRFITEDSVNDPNNPHEYVYGANNPVRYIDPTGHMLVGPMLQKAIFNKAVNYVVSKIPGLSEALMIADLFVGSPPSEYEGDNDVIKSGRREVDFAEGKIKVSDTEGKQLALYDANEMKEALQKLGNLQQGSDKKASAQFEMELKTKYGDFFDAIQGGKNNTTMFGLRGWGLGKSYGEGGERPYDDMFLVISDEGVGVFDEFNFEGSISSKDTENGGKTNPSIENGNFTYETGLHKDEFKALHVNGNDRVNVSGSNLNKPIRDTKKNIIGYLDYATKIHIHPGGNGWNSSHGCLTLHTNGANSAEQYKDPNWVRFMSYFPDGTKGNLYIRDWGL